MNRSTLYIVVICLLILSGLFGYYIGRNEVSIVPVSRPTTVDTVGYVIKSKPIPKQDVVVPATRTVGKSDTAARKKAERSKIVTSVVRRSDFLDITTIDIQGVSQIETYAIPPEIDFQVDSSGTVGVDPKAERKARRRHTWGKIGRTAVLVGVGVVGVLLGRRI